MFDSTEQDSSEHMFEQIDRVVQILKLDFQKNLY